MFSIMMRLTGTPMLKYRQGQEQFQDPIIGLGFPACNAITSTVKKFERDGDKLTVETKNSVYTYMHGGQEEVNRLISVYGLKHVRVSKSGSVYWS